MPRSVFLSLIEKVALISEDKPDGAFLVVLCTDCPYFSGSFIRGSTAFPATITKNALHMLNASYSPFKTFQEI